MGIVNEITLKIIANLKDGESVRSLAARIGFAYSAVYGWILSLERYELVRVIRKGNRNIIRINKNPIYDKFLELNKAVSVIEKDIEFWRFAKDTRLKIRFARGSAIAIWTKGGFITGDFYDKIYFLEADKKDVASLKNALKEKKIEYTEDKLTNARPLVYISSKSDLKAEKIRGLPVMPLKELVAYCKKLYLDNVLEQLDLLYHLNLNKRYSEIYTNN